MIQREPTPCQVDESVDKRLARPDTLTAQMHIATTTQNFLMVVVAEAVQATRRIAMATKQMATIVA